jgi:enoyl-CoA hydratase
MQKRTGQGVPPNVGQAMRIDELTIDPRRLWRGETLWDAPMAFIDLDRCGGLPGDVALPPCPVIGIGDATSPLAPLLDTVIEPPVVAATIMRQIGSNPHAAAVVVQVLRLVPSLPMAQALVAESLAYSVLQASAEHARWQAMHVASSAGPTCNRGRVLLDRRGDALHIALDRAEAGNAIDQPMRDGLAEAFAIAALDRSIRVVRLTGMGRTFSLGAELAEFGTTSDPATAHQIRSLTLPAHAIARCAERLEVHVQGGCVGAGLEMAAFARRITAAPDAWFQLPELAMGILPGAGGCVSVTRRIGRQRAALMILSGKRLSAQQALGWGLVDEIAGDDGGTDPG